MDEFYIIEDCHLINSKNVCECYLDYCIAITDCEIKYGANDVLKSVELLIA